MCKLIEGEMLEKWKPKEVDTAAAPAAPADPADPAGKGNGKGSEKGKAKAEGVSAEDGLPAD